jgi:hypothetical protein
MFLATIPSSTDQRLATIAARVHRAGPDALLQMMRAQLTSTSAMTVFESFGAALLLLPSRPAPACIIVDISSRFQSTARQ